MGIIDEAGIELSDNVKETVLMYGEMRKSFHKIETLTAMGPAHAAALAQERTRFNRLEDKVNALFNTLSHDDQHRIVDKLILEKIMPEDLKDILTIYKARISNASYRLRPNK